MPIWRYFLTVGTALWMSFYLVNAYADKHSPAIKSDHERMPIRIASVNPTPELVVIDTTVPTITPPSFTEYRIVPEIPDRISLAVAPRPIDLPPIKRKKVMRRAIPQQIAVIPWSNASNTPW